MFRKKFIGDGVFYSRVFAIMLPILFQNLITNFVSLLDNIMVGQVGTEPMSGVAIVNQLLFVFNLAMFGIVSGGGVFGAQFYGKGDHKGVANTVKTKLYAVIILIAASFAISYFAGDILINNFLHEGGDDLDINATFMYAKQYLSVMLWGLIPFGIKEAFGSSLREISHTEVPMKAGITAVFVNLVFNYILIYGKFGAPALGVAGAAIATVISRYVELAVILVWIVRHQDEVLFIKNFGNNIKEIVSIPSALLKEIVRIGIPMFLNELLWGSGQTILNQIMSNRGLEVVSAINISSTVTMLFQCFYLSVGLALSIILGQSLGAGEMERAIDEDNKITFLSLALTTIVTAIMLALARVIPEIYNTTDIVKNIAAELIIVNAIFLPMGSVIICFYYTIRSGGKTFITFLFDSCFTWVILIPLTYFLVFHSSLDIVKVYTLYNLASVIKLVIGFILVKSKFWLVNLVKDK